MVSSDPLPIDDGRARFFVLALRDPHLLECVKRNKIDPPIHTGYFYTGEENTLIFIVDGGNTVNYFVMCSKVHWNMVVPPGNIMTCTYKFSRLSTS